VQAPAAESPKGRRVDGTVTHVNRTTGRVTVHAEGRDADVQYPRARARRMKAGDHVTVVVVGTKVSPAPSGSALTLHLPPVTAGDPGPPAKEIPPPAGYPIGPGMGPAGAGSPNAGDGSPVGADGAR
jgi:hypothetical protein